jgi:hypothetical protein
MCEHWGTFGWTDIRSWNLAGERNEASEQKGQGVDAAPIHQAGRKAAERAAATACPTG